MLGLCLNQGFFFFLALSLYIFFFLQFTMDYFDNEEGDFKVNIYPCLISQVLHSERPHPSLGI